MNVLVLVLLSKLPLLVDLVAEVLQVVIIYLLPDGWNEVFGFLRIGAAEGSFKPMSVIKLSRLFLDIPFWERIDEPSWERSNFSSSVRPSSRLEMADILSRCWKRANMSRYSCILSSVLFVPRKRERRGVRETFRRSIGNSLNRLT